MNRITNYFHYYDFTKRRDLDVIIPNCGIFCPKVLNLLFIFQLRYRTHFPPLGSSILLRLQSE